jgi:GAF domain-containing protein
VALQAALTTLASGHGFRCALIALCGADGSAQSTVAAAGEVARFDGRFALHAAVKEAARLAQPIAHEGGLLAARETVSADTRSICVPIVARHLGTLGVLACERGVRSDGWPRDDIELLSVVAGLLAHPVSLLHAEHETRSERDRERTGDGHALRRSGAHGFLACGEVSKQALS